MIGAGLCCGYFVGLFHWGFEAMMVGIKDHWEIYSYTFTFDITPQVVKLGVIVFIMYTLRIEAPPKRRRRRGRKGRKKRKRKHNGDGHPHPMDRFNNSHIELEMQEATQREPKEGETTEEKELIWEGYLTKQQFFEG